MTGRELRAIRLEKGLSMAEIAKKVGLCRQTIQAIENGKKDNILHKLFKAYGLSVVATSDQNYNLNELDHYKFIILRTEHIGITSQNGSFIKLEILKDDIGKAVYANRVTVELGADDD